MGRRTQTSPLATCRAWNDVSWLVVQSLDCETTIEARRLERSHRCLRPNKDDQLATVCLLAPARAEEQGERCRVKIDDQVAHFCQRVCDCRRAEKVEFAGKDEDR
jgi:hypothetical protein